MKYKAIIQELKEKADPNVLAFLKDVENKKRLSKRDRQYYCSHLQDPEAIDRLVSDLIPSIIRVAFKFSLHTKSMTILDLVNEGVVGAYRFFDKYRYKKDGASPRQLRAYMISSIEKAVCKKECPFPMCHYDEQNPQLEQELSAMWSSYSKKDKREADRRKAFNYVRNAFGIMIKQCCASCEHKDLTRASKSRYCTQHERDVKPTEVCCLWKMNNQMKAAGIR